MGGMGTSKAPDPGSPLPKKKKKKKKDRVPGLGDVGNPPKKKRKS